MSDVRNLLQEAERLSQASETWADLSNALFDPIEGLVTLAFPTREARERYLKSEESGAIRRLLAESRKKHGLVEGGTPKKSGKFVVRIPRTLHAALEREAVSEGVSLNQLVVAKLAVGLGRGVEIALG